MAAGYRRMDEPELPAQRIDIATAHNRQPPLQLFCQPIQQGMKGAGHLHRLGPVRQRDERAVEIEKQARADQKVARRGGQGRRARHAAHLMAFAALRKRGAPPFPSFDRTSGRAPRSAGHAARESHSQHHNR